MLFACLMFRAILTAEVLVGFAIVILCSSVLSTEKTVCRSHVTSDTKVCACVNLVLLP